MLITDSRSHLAFVPKNPGRVVTLVHKEDWDGFSASVRVVSTFEQSYPFPALNRMRFRMKMSYGASISATYLTRGIFIERLNRRSVYHRHGVRCRSARLLG